MTNKDVYQSGNTIRLTCEFFDFDGLKKDPQTIKVKFMIINTMSSAKSQMLNA